jgi:hypothetical protein
MLNPMYPRIGLAACLSSGYTGSHLNEPTRAASLTQTAPARWVSFPTAQVVSSPPTCTCQGGHAKSERRREAPLLRTATPPRQCRTCIAGRLFFVLALVPSGPACRPIRSPAPASRGLKPDACATVHSDSSVCLAQMHSMGPQPSSRGVSRRRRAPRRQLARPVSAAETAGAKEGR